MVGCSRGACQPSNSATAAPEYGKAVVVTEPRRAIPYCIGVTPSSVVLMIRQDRYYCFVYFPSKSNDELRTTITMKSTPHTSVEEFTVHLHMMRMRRSE